jgi:hypothetical protein
MGISGISGYSTPQLAPGGATSSGVSAGSLGSLLTGAAGLYGSQNAAEAQTQAIQGGINTQTQTMGNINSLYGAQTNLGNSAMNALGQAQGLNGAAPNYSGFMNMPGYQFSQQMGVQAAERQAAAMGNAGNSGTSALIGNQVAGTAMQDYNTYISQLMGSAGLGAQANTGLSGAQIQTGTNISQMQQNAGQANATGVSSGANAVGGVIGGLANSLTNGGGLGNIASSIGSGVSNLLGGSGGVNYSPTPAPGSYYSSTGAGYGGTTSPVDMSGFDTSGDTSGTSDF